MPAIPAREATGRLPPHLDLFILGGGSFARDRKIRRECHAINRNRHQAKPKTKRLLAVVFARPLRCKPAAWYSIGLIDTTADE